MLTTGSSCDCLQSRSRPRRPSSRAKRLPVRGGWHQDQRSTGQGEWTYQPLPFDLHITICTVRTNPPLCANCDVSFSLDYSGHFLEYLLNRNDVKDAWRAHTEHEFVQRIADGTLPVEKFKYYLIQDYLFLVSTPRSYQQPNQ